MQKYAFYFGLAALLSACGGAQQPAGTAQQPSGAASGDIIDNTLSTNNSYPGAAMLLASLETSLQLYQGDINLPVNWQVKDFPAVNEWTLTLDGESVYSQHITPLSQLNSLKTLSNIAAGQHTMQVSACATAELCLQSNPITFNVLDNPPQNNLSDSVRIFSLYDLQQCMSYDLQGLKIEACSDTPEQRWIIRESSLSPAEHPELCVSAGDFTSLQRAGLAPCAAVAALHWEFSSQVFHNQGYALDVNRSNQQVIIYPQHNGLNQQWTTSPPQDTGGTDEITPAPQNPSPDIGSGSIFGTSYDPQWTFLNMPTEGNYGHYEFDVPALQNWVNSGLFLRKGQTAYISASGTWSVKEGVSYGPTGHATARARGCAEGALVARQGLYTKMKISPVSAVLAHLPLNVMTLFISVLWSVMI